MWYGKKISSEASMQGEHVQKVRIDKSGKIYKEIPIWRKPVPSPVNPEEIIGFEETEENTGDPWLE